MTRRMRFGAELEKILFFRAQPQTASVVSFFPGDIRPTISKIVGRISPGNLTCVVCGSKKPDLCGGVWDAVNCFFNIRQKELLESLDYIERTQARSVDERHSIFLAREVLINNREFRCLGYHGRFLEGSGIGGVLSAPLVDSTLSHKAHVCFDGSQKNPKRQIRRYVDDAKTLSSRLCDDCLRAEVESTCYHNAPFEKDRELSAQMGGNGTRRWTTRWLHYEVSITAAPGARKFEFSTEPILKPLAAPIQRGLSYLTMVLSARLLIAKCGTKGTGSFDLEKTQSFFWAEFNRWAKEMGFRLARTLFLGLRMRDQISKFIHPIVNLASCAKGLHDVMFAGKCRV